MLPCQVAGADWQFVSSLVLIPLVAFVASVAERVAVAKEFVELQELHATHFPSSVACLSVETSCLRRKGLSSVGESPLQVFGIRVEEPWRYEAVASAAVAEQPAVGEA